VDNVRMREDLTESGSNCAVEFFPAHLPVVSSRNPDSFSHKVNSLSFLTVLSLVLKF